MRKILCILALVLASSFAMKAQDTTKVNVPYESAVDSSLINKSVFSLLSSASGGNAVIDQSDQVRSSFERYMASRSGKKSYGYKILVYSSNSKEARGASSSIAGALKSKYPHLNVYRSFKTPFFMVHIGDFRTKADAMKIIYELSSTYRQAKVIKSPIGWYAF
jgi:septal ring-binding cell division protein DamX